MQDTKRMMHTIILILCSLITIHAQDATSPITGLRINRPMNLKKQYTDGMLHSMALFGVPHYGKKLGPIRIYDATNNTETDGCSNWIAPQQWANDGPFAVLVNRGKCTFVTKIRYAQNQGAAAVIVRDNKLLLGQPGSFCPNYEKPEYTDPNSGVKSVCNVGRDHKQCKCTESSNVVPTALPSVPRCGNDNTADIAVYEDQQAYCGAQTAPCWRCPAPSTAVFPLECDGSPTSTCAKEYHEPFMADDGTGGSISIPSMIVSDYDGENLRNAIHQTSTFITMAWDIPQKSDVSYEMWTSSEDHNGAEFKRDFQEIAVELRDSTTFKPRYFIYDGVYQQCYDRVDCQTFECLACKDLCILNGLYCGPDPDGTFDGVKGADIVKENLRQLCIFDVLTKSSNDPKQRKAAQGKWWCYANAFANNCYGEEGKMESSETFEQCAKDEMQSVGIDQAAVEQCIVASGGVTCTASGTNCQENTLLKKEVTERKNFGILSLPSIVVNGVLLRTASTAGGAAEKTVTEAICHAFAAGYAPEVCDELDNPMGTSGSSGIASVEFEAELSYDGNYKYAPEIGTRFRDTMSMKLGIDPNAVRLKTLKEGSKSTTLQVTLTRLMCTDELDETETVAQMLNKVNSCQQAVVDAGDADKEIESLEGKFFYFHTHIPSDKKTHVVAAKMTKVTKNCAAHNGVKGNDGSNNNSGPSWTWLIIITIFILAIVGVGGFVWYQRVRNDMREQVQSILEQYQPLEDIPSFKNNPDDERETAAML